MSKVFEAVLKAKREQKPSSRVHMMLPLVEKPTPTVSTQCETLSKPANGQASRSSTVSVLAKTSRHSETKGTTVHASAGANGQTPSRNNGQLPINGTNGQTLPKANGQMPPRTLSRSVRSTNGQVPARTNGQLPISGANGHSPSALIHRLPRAGHPSPAPRSKGNLWKLVRGRFGAPDEHLVSLTSPGSFASEQYRHLRHTVEQLKRKKGLSVIAVCSPAPGEGKTVTALNLAGSLSEGSATRVLVVECDLRRPTIAKYLKMRFTTPGLSEFVSTSDRTGLIQMHPSYNLAILPSGNTTAAPHEILKSDRLREFLRSARSHFDFVIIDCPPLAPVSDCLLIQELVDGMIVVVRANRAPRETIEKAVRCLDQQKILGVVFNGDKHFSKKYKKHGTSRR